MDGRGDQNKHFLLYNHRSQTNSYISRHLRTQTLRVWWPFKRFCWHFVYRYCSNVRPPAWIHDTQRRDNASLTRWNTHGVLCIMYSSRWPHVWTISVNKMSPKPFKWSPHSQCLRSKVTTDVTIGFQPMVMQQKSLFWCPLPFVESWVLSFATPCNCNLVRKGGIFNGPGRHKCRIRPFPGLRRIRWVSRLSWKW